MHCNSTEAVPETSNTAQVGQLYMEHKNWLSVFLYRKLGCSETSADLLQDTYLRLLNRQSLPPARESRKYLTYIAKGLVVDLYRRRRIEQAYIEYLEQQPEPEYPSPEVQAQAVQALVEIDNLLHRLSDKARRAFLMKQLDGLSYKEIAFSLGVSVSSVEKYIAKALQTCMLAALEVQ
ncbi:sigma-70 family RNA polymerase sigma factor [Endozoicomonadaceae bacterium StTr2]